MRYSSLAAALLMLVGLTLPASASTLEDVKGRGHLNCGVSTGLAGFALPSASGEWVGFDVDFCRAVAAAIFNDPSKVKFTPLTNKERFTALQSGEIDVLSRNTTWTMTRDMKLGLEFAGVNYYDGQGFLVPIALGVQSALELDGARVCVQTGTTTELNLADYFRGNNMEFESVVISTADDARTNYLAEACDVYTTDASGLAALRSTFPDPSAHIILPEIISKEPLGLIVRHGDNQWGDLVRWTLNAMINAEELGLTSQNVGEFEDDPSPKIRRLLGKEGDFGEQIGLDALWARHVIEHVGNYGEVFDRNLGKDSTLSLDRGLNALWSEGGILFAPPVR
ncbi:MAG: amino acid ABC transporter substrate-binding protein [Alphaproteobacteria bacterium]|nr:MAG: amino acid ABC transporter substrate-binding protein [Alphaproteobacteria bacterium]